MNNDWFYDKSTIKKYDKAIHLVRDIAIWNVQYQERRDFREFTKNKGKQYRTLWRGGNSENGVVNGDQKIPNSSVKIVCYHCREEGYKKTTCSKLNVISTSSNGIMISANGIGSVIEKKKIKFHEPSLVEWKEINSAYPAVSNLIYTEVNIHDLDNKIHTVLGMIDNGGQATIVKDEIVKQLKLGDSVRRLNFKIKGFFSNEQVRVKGEITLELSIGKEETIRTNAIIIDDGCIDSNLDIILGVTLKDYVKNIVSCTILKGEVKNKSNRMHLVQCCKIMVQQHNIEM